MNRMKFYDRHGGVQVIEINPRMRDYYGKQVPSARPANAQAYVIAARNGWSRRKPK